MTATSQGYGSARRSQQEQSQTKRVTSRNFNIGSLAGGEMPDAFERVERVYYTSIK
jgi:hypothetical protein